GRDDELSAVDVDASVPNKADDHGTHVAGIIGAAYDNPATLPEPSKRSRGVSGGNPFADIRAWSASSINGQRFNKDGASLSDKELELWNHVLGSDVIGLRVINYSYGGSVFYSPDAWWAHFKGLECGPGPTDDTLPDALGGKDFCTPNNEDRWLHE